MKSWIVPAAAVSLVLAGLTGCANAAAGPVVGLDGEKSCVSLFGDRSGVLLVDASFENRGSHTVTVESVKAKNLNGLVVASAPVVLTSSSKFDLRPMNSAGHTNPELISASALKNAPVAHGSVIRPHQTVQIGLRFSLAAASKSGSLGPATIKYKVGNREYSASNDAYRGASLAKNCTIPESGND